MRLRALWLAIPLLLAAAESFPEVAVEVTSVRGYKPLRRRPGAVCVQYSIHNRGTLPVTEVATRLELPGRKGEAVFRRSATDYLHVSRLMAGQDRFTYSLETGDAAELLFEPGSSRHREVCITEDDGFDYSLWKEGHARVEIRGVQTAPAPQKDSE